MYEVQEYKKPLTAVQVRAQVQLIQEVMAAVMEKDVHYGTIPGTQKPTLYKAGSEKILTTFHIAAYPKEVEDLSTPDEIRYRVKVHGLSIDDGRLIGVGIGECSSNEEKYKWRKPVCDAEFNESPDDRKRIVWKKYEGQVYQQKQVRMNPSDVANTILKMAKKRGQIDLTLTATAASDVFDQDLEDMDDVTRESVAPGKPPLTKPGKKQDKADAPQTAGTVEFCPSDVTKSTGTNKKTNKPWTKFSIKDGETAYNTFSETFATTAKEAKEAGRKIKVTFNTGKYGNDIELVEFADDGPGREPGEDDK